MAPRGHLIDGLNRIFAEVADWSVDHPKSITAIVVVLAGIGLYFASGARPDNSLDSYFVKNDPTLISYKEYVKEFNSDEITYILYRVPNTEYGPFDLDAMRKIIKLTDTLELELPFVRKVTSLANAEFIEADGDFLKIHDLMYEAPETQEELLKLRDLAMSKPTYVAGIIDKTAIYAAIIVDMSRTSTDPIEKIRYNPEGGDGTDNVYPYVSYYKVKEILARPEYQGIDFYLSGDAPLNAWYAETEGREITTQTLASFVLVGFISAILMRIRFAGLIGPLVVVSLSLILSVGLIGLLKVKISMLFMLFPVLLTAIGVAQCVHLLSEYQHQLNLDNDKKRALKSAVGQVGAATLACAVTTALGFLATGPSKLRPLQDFAIYASFGVMMTFVFSITVLIVILSLGQRLSTKRAERKPGNNPVIAWMIEKIIAFDLKRPKLIIGLWAALVAVAVVGIALLRVDFNYMTEIKEHVEVRQHMQKAEDTMGGFLSTVYIFDTGTPDGIKNPALLARIERLQHLADTQELVKKSYSLPDILKDINQSFHGGDRAYYKIPEDRQTIAQYLMIYEMSGGNELEKFVNFDRSKTILTLRVKLADASKVRNVIGVLNKSLQDDPVLQARVEVTGIGFLWIKFAEFISHSQISAYSLAFVMIALVLWVLFGFKSGMLAMIPNVLPIVLVLGYLGWRDIHLDYMKILLATTVMGVAVDDTIHLLARFRSEFLRHADYRRALTETLRVVGPPMTITSIILSLAFLVFLNSEMAILAQFGVLLAGTFTVALLADLFLTPALILTFRPFGEPGKIAAEEHKIIITPNQTDPQEIGG